jgi:hypothetical protein
MKKIGKKKLMTAMMAAHQAGMQKGAMMAAPKPAGPPAGAPPMPPPGAGAPPAPMGRPPGMRKGGIVALAAGGRVDVNDPDEASERSIGKGQHAIQKRGHTRGRFV